MIEKKIHYVWMGKGKKSELILNCIKSWKKNLSDYEIIEWNEENFDITSNKYVFEAYQNKKWAFVSDYVRLYALYNYGGIYLDTDMEILKPIDHFLQHRAFSGFESKDYIPTGIMGAEKAHPWIKDLLQYYENKSFIKSDGSFDLTPNVDNITKITIENYGLRLNNKHQKLKDDLYLYPKEFFCPSDYGDSLKQKQKKLTLNSHSIHHYNGSWLTPIGKFKVKIRNILGKANIDRLKKLTRRGS
jgi:hypothetical protein